VSERWKQICLQSDKDDSAWEIYHENSKASRHDPGLPTAAVLARMAELWESLPYQGYPAIPLPRALRPLTASLGESLAARASARRLRPGHHSLEDLATLLHHAYGITRDNAGTVFPRPFRSVPSGGGLYPLEIFLHATHVEGLHAGIYHFNAVQHQLRLLREGDQSRKLCEALVQQNLGVDTSLMIFITAVFERSVFKYSDRGYRFVLLEAGHVAQNLNLVASGLGLGSVNIGGFFDRSIDALLGLDGLTHSTLYLVGVGEEATAEPSPLGAQ
jgi:SagB-type dehydrogenase family enzyme